MGVFVSESSNLIGVVCAGSLGSCTRDPEVKGEVLSWKYRARDRKEAGMRRRGLGNQCDQKGTLQAQSCRHALHFTLLS